MSGGVAPKAPLLGKTCGTVRRCASKYRAGALQRFTLLLAGKRRPRQGAQQV